MGTEADFKKMLDQDRLVYANIVKGFTLQNQSAQLLLKEANDAKARGDSEKGKAILRAIDLWKLRQSKLSGLYKQFKARQADIKDNTALKAAKAVKTWGGQLSDWFKSKLVQVLATGVAGMAAAPAVVPIVYAAAGVVSITVLAYFVSKYKKETSSSLQASAQVLGEIAQINPQLANTLAREIAEVEKQSDNNSLSTQIGEGIKVMLYVGSAAIGGKILYDVLVKQKVIKPLRLKA